MKKYKEIDLYPEEILLDSRGAGLIEKPLSYGPYYLIFLTIIFCGAIIIGRLFNLALIDFENFRNIAEANSGKEIPLRAPRGIIYDRFKKPLVENVPAFRAIINLNEFYKNYTTVDQRKDFLKRVAQFLELDSRILEERIEAHENFSYLVLPGLLSRDQLIAVKEFNSPILSVENSYRRKYIDDEITAQILGYVGLVNVDDLRKNNYLKINDEVGRTGLEFAYDKILRGEEGKSLIIKDSRGNVLDKIREISPKSGVSLITTIDSDFQEYFFKRLEGGLRFLGRRSAVGIALNPQNGEILSLVSLPSFQNNSFGNDNKIVDSILKNKGRPLFNRAVSGLYNPGSTIKPLMSLAALKEGVVDVNKAIYSKGFIEIPNPYNPDNPSRFVDWKPHGWVDFYSALAKSSNIYFYSIGGGFEDVVGLGIERLKKYWIQFGLGVKTGIDLPYESLGYLPDPEEKENKSGDIWRIGDTYNVSIGQGDLLLTPIQLINQIASFANNGRLYRPHLIFTDKEPEIIKDNSDLSDMIYEVKRGMTDVVSKDYGTAHMLNTLPIAVAGKTGSAQVANNTKTNAFFVGYIDDENPELAILILIEDAKEGSLNAVPIAYDIFEWYYWNRIIK